MVPFTITSLRAPGVQIIVTEIFWWGWGGEGEGRAGGYEMTIIDLVQYSSCGVQWQGCYNFYRKGQEWSRKKMMRFFNLMSEMHRTWRWLGSKMTSKCQHRPKLVF